MVYDKFEILSTFEDLQSDIIKKNIDLNTKRHNKKLVKLSQSTKNATQVQTKNTIKNLSDTIIPEEIQLLLSQDPKFAIRPKDANQIPTDQIIANIEANITKLNQENQNEIRIKLNNTLIEHHDKVKNEKLNFKERKDITAFNKTKKFLRDNPQIVVTRADKGNSTVVMNKSTYETKIRELLSDTTTYKRIKRDLTNSLQKHNNDIIKKWENSEFISPTLARSLTVHNSISPKIYGLPKLHKPNIPLRPIISYTQTPFYKLSKYLASGLSNVINKNPFYTKNSYELKQELDTLYVPDDQKLFSIDAVSLYTNIPTQLVPQILEEKWHLIEKYTDLPKTEFIEAVQLTLGTCYFQYEDEFYQQIDGVAMGSPVAGAVAQLVLEYFEEKVLLNSSYRITIFKRTGQ
ncbi:uncharacterized protein LOC123313092 [Coccinella septempunctata]|uniref:uncharacterized protein LOC123313092 n=1 Tax=Coccinella septempunctata TaxID=41139 RepID=UPI001D07875A|nr:uncharacterized protein LOC123313092 [Coccinella septempunctata]